MYNANTPCWDRGNSTRTVTPTPTQHTHVDDPRTAVVEDERPCADVVVRPR
jgi:hypothetical protein